jgi:outer membrane protein
VLKSKAGQAAVRELQAKAAPKEEALKTLQSEISGLREQLSKAEAIASSDKQAALSREIEQKTKTLNRKLEDFQVEMEQEQTRILNGLGSRMLAIINQYASRQGYALIVDVSAPQNPVLFASPPLDVTAEVIKMFDESKPE